MKKGEQGQTATGVLLAILGLIVAGAIVVGAWQLSWWIKGETVNRTAKINRTSYEVQQTYHEEVIKDIATVRDLDRQIADPSYAASIEQNNAARAAQVTVTCDHISRLPTSGAGVDPDVTAFHNKECIA